MTQENSWVSARVIRSLYDLKSAFHEVGYYYADKEAEEKVAVDMEMAKVRYATLMPGWKQKIVLLELGGLVVVLEYKGFTNNIDPSTEIEMLQALDAPIEGLIDSAIESKCDDCDERMPDEPMHNEGYD